MCVRKNRLYAGAKSPAGASHPDTTAMSSHGRNKNHSLL